MKKDYFLRYAKEYELSYFPNFPKLNYSLLQTKYFGTKSYRFTIYFRLKKYVLYSPYSYATEKITRNNKSTYDTPNVGYLLCKFFIFFRSQKNFLYHPTNRYTYFDKYFPVELIVTEHEIMY